MYEEMIEIKDVGTHAKKQGIIRELSISDIDNMLVLQDEVVMCLDNKDIFITLSPLEIEFIFNGNGYIYGLIVEEKLFAYVGFVYPRYREDNLGFDLNIDKENFEYIVHFETAVVDQKVRGNRIQFQLAKRVVEKIVSLNNMKYILSTVSPLNIPSLMAILDLGLVIKDLKEKYNGKLRYVLSLELNTKRIDFKDIIKVRIDDYKKQLNLIQNGFLGISYFKDKDDFYINYGIRD